MSQFAKRWGRVIAITLAVVLGAGGLASLAVSSANAEVAGFGWRAVYVNGANSVVIPGDATVTLSNAERGISVDLVAPNGYVSFEQFATPEFAGVLWTLHVAPPASSGYLPKYWDGKTAADTEPILISASGLAPAVFVDADPAKTGTVSGRIVSSADAGVGLRTYVTLTNRAGGSTVSHSTFTETGDFSFSGVFPGVYDVALEAYSIAPAYPFGNAPAELGVTPGTEPITVVAQGVVDSSYALSPNARISGTVSALSGGTVTPVAGDYVQLFTPDGDIPTGYGFRTVVNTDGSFALDVAAGTYRVGFGSFDETVGFTVKQAWNQVATIAEATDVSLVATQETPGVSAVYGAGQ